MQKSYFNTTNESPQMLMEFTNKALKQEMQVLEVFCNHGKQSASQVWQKLNQAMPLTSVRRAITVLKNKGKLYKTGERRKGYYGKSELVWNRRNQLNAKG